MISFFKKIIFLAIVLSLSMYASMSHAQSTVRPDLAPILSNPTPANCEFYTQKGGTPIKRVPLDILMNTLSPKAVPTPALAYVPTASGNPVNDRNKIVIGANGITYYIDPNGAGIVLGGAGAGYTAGTGISVSGNVITNIGDLSATNEIQTLSKPTAGTLRLQNTQGLGHNLVFLPDSSSTNEMQTLSIIGDSLSISGRNKIQLPSGSIYTGGSGISVSGSVISAVDASTTNEIQALSISGQNLSISGGNTVTLPSATSYTAGTGIYIVANAINNTGDLSTTNEIQTLSKPSAGTYKLTNGSSASTFIVAADSSATNEIQTLSKPSAGTYKLTNGTGASTYIVAADSSATNELQVLSQISTGTYRLTHAVFGNMYIYFPDSSATNEIELPSQAGNSGKYLSTNGTTPSWANPPGGADDWGSQAVNASADFAGDGGASAQLELTLTGVSAGTYNNVTVDTRGRVSAGSNASYITSEVDGSITNEIQTLSKPTTGTLKLTNGAAASTFIALPDSSATNEIELPSIAGQNGKALLVNGAATEWGVVDRSETNEIQTLSRPNSGTLRLTNPGFASTFITLPDSSATNEIELPSQATHSGKFLSTNGTTASWAAALTTEVDGSITNEIQALSRPNTGTLRLTNPGSASTFVTLPDSSATNEIQTISLSGQDLSISGGNTVTLPVGTTYTAGAGITLGGNVIVNTGDLSTTNELQTLSISSNTLTISSGNSVSLPVATAKEYISGAQSFPSNLGSVGTFAQIPIYLRSGKSYTLVYKTPTGNITDTTGSFPSGVLGANTTYIITLSIASGQTGFDPNRGISWLIKEN
jgi:hypothetical protein